MNNTKLEVAKKLIENDSFHVSAQNPATLKKSKLKILKVISTKGLHSWVEAKSSNGIIRIKKENVNIPAKLLHA